MKIIFLGTPQFAKTILESLFKKHEILLVVTQPDKEVGRKRKLLDSPVKIFAIENNLNIFQPISLKKEYQRLLDLKPDLIITAAYGQMLPRELLEKVTSINVHGSLLPKYRGGAPIQYALFDGLDKTGITIMYMANKMDSGDIIKQEEIAISKVDDYLSLSIKLANLGAKLLLEVLEDMKNGIVTRTKQNENEVTYAYTLKLPDELIDFNQNSDKIINRLRGLSPNPGGFSYLKGVPIKLYKAIKNDIIDTDSKPGTVLEAKKQLIVKTLDGAVEILEIQLPGKKRLAIKDFLNGQTLINKNDYFSKEN